MVTEFDLLEVAHFCSEAAFKARLRGHLPYALTAEHHADIARQAANDIHDQTPHCPPMYWTDGHHYTGDGSGAA